MPLSKAKNRERMRKARLHKRLLPLTEPKPVQPKSIRTIKGVIVSREKATFPTVELDADGNVIPELS